MPPESNVESTLVWYEKNNPKNFEYWIKEIESFLEGNILQKISVMERDALLVKNDAHLTCKIKYL